MWHSCKSRFHLSISKLKRNWYRIFLYQIQFFIMIFYAKHFSHKLKNLNTFKASNLTKQTLATCAITFNMRWPAHIVCLLCKWPKFNWTHLLLFTVHGKDMLNLLNQNFFTNLWEKHNYSILISLLSFYMTFLKHSLNRGEWLHRKIAS